MSKETKQKTAQELVIEAVKALNEVKALASEKEAPKEITRLIRNTERKLEVMFGRVALWEAMQ